MEQQGRAEHVRWADHSMHLDGFPSSVSAADLLAAQKVPPLISVTKASHAQHLAEKPPASSAHLSAWVFKLTPQGPVVESQTP